MHCTHCFEWIKVCESTQHQNHLYNGKFTVQPMKCVYTVRDTHFQIPIGKVCSVLRCAIIISSRDSAWNSKWDAALDADELPAAILKLPHSTTVPNLSFVGLCLCVVQLLLIFTIFAIFSSSNSEAFAKRVRHKKKRIPQNFIDFCCNALRKDVAKRKEDQLFTLKGHCSWCWCRCCCFFSTFYSLIFERYDCNKIGNFQPTGIATPFFPLYFSMFNVCASVRVKVLASALCGLCRINAISIWNHWVNTNGKWRMKTIKTRVWIHFVSNSKWFNKNCAARYTKMQWLILFGAVCVIKIYQV